MAALLLQVALGIANVVLQLPLGLAVAHNGGAALLLLTVLTLVHSLSPVPQPRLARGDGTGYEFTRGNP